MLCFLRILKILRHRACLGLSKSSLALPAQIRWYNKSVYRPIWRPFSPVILVLPAGRFPGTRNNLPRRSTCAINRVTPMAEAGGEVSLRDRIVETILELRDKDFLFASIFFLVRDMWQTVMERNWDLPTLLEKAQCFGKTNLVRTCRIYLHKKSTATDCLSTTVGAQHADDSNLR